MTQLIHKSLLRARLRQSALLLALSLVTCASAAAQQFCATAQALTGTTATYGVKHDAGTHAPATAHTLPPPAPRRARRPRLQPRRQHTLQDS